MNIKDIFVLRVLFAYFWCLENFWVGGVFNWLTVVCTSFRHLFQRFENCLKLLEKTENFKQIFTCRGHGNDEKSNKYRAGSGLPTGGG
jgi:hypothetical protein